VQPRLVLVVGGSLRARSLIQLVLERLSYRVACAVDLRSARDLLERQPVDLVLAAAEPDGRIAAVFARELRGHHGVPILLFGDAGELSRARMADPALSPADCFARPLELDRLIARVRSVLAARPAAAAGVDEDLRRMGRRLVEVAGDQTTARELAELFVRTARAYLAGLEEETADARFREVAHALKGAARNVGAVHLATLAEELEHGGRNAALLARARRHFEALAATLSQEVDATG